MHHGGRTLAGRNFESTVVSFPVKIMNWILQLRFYMKNNTTQLAQGSTEISIFDAVNFLVVNWKAYLAGIVLGGIVGLSVAFFVPNYTAEGALNYRVSPKFTVHESIGVDGFADSRFDLITWRIIQSKLTFLAQEEIGRTQGASQIMIAMTSPDWWSQHVVPVYALTNSEAKELLGINGMVIGTNKPSEDSGTTRFLGRAIEEATRINRLVVSISGVTAEMAMSDVALVVEFIRDGITFLEYQSLVESQLKSVLISENQMVTDTHRLNLDLAIHRRKREEMLRLQQEFANERNLAQLINPRDTDAKFLPLATQLIAVDLDINETNERLIQLKQQREKNSVVEIFVKQAASILSKGMHNKKLVEEIFSLEAAIRLQIGQGETNREMALSKIHDQLIAAQSSVQMQLFPAGMPSIVQQPQYTKSALRGGVLGLAFVFFLSLFILLIRFSARYRATR